LDYLSPIHGQGNGPAKSDAATAAIALIFQTDCAKTKLIETGKPDADLK
jgi:hypothetical protein